MAQADWFGGSPRVNILLAEKPVWTVLAIMEIVTGYKNHLR
jgi:hypothetical protein